MLIIEFGNFPDTRTVRIFSLKLTYMNCSLAQTRLRRCPRLEDPGSEQIELQQALPHFADMVYDSHETAASAAASVDIPALEESCLLIPTGFMYS